MEKGQEIRVNLPENTSHVTIEVIDLLGRVISTYKDGVAITSPEIPGVYTVKVTDHSGNACFAKLVVR